ncbi:NTP pyrophosphatase (non-canonical NTP hydrolase) [Kribbella amoyensis]|uniref:NTP pyrophosphatase (Non-canonical NTP hydrolase) n=1 Tax=Kribbella amoyensis TaxID=996641 RepID=A0A561BWF7_9ACTN|nr:pyrophosphatase [Kribbella amoyensis]TWD83201.1 NTP pyrophosphatase (non-canonical NTP hydrolase) [Kribbella amoyensis]
MDITELTERLEKLSANYAEHYGFERTGDWFLLKLQEEVGELTQAHLQTTGRARTKGRTPEELRETLELEFADALCQLILFARHHDVDLPSAVERKWLSKEAGWTRQVLDAT